MVELMPLDALLIQGGHAPETKGDRRGHRPECTQIQGLLFPEIDAQKAASPGGRRGQFSRRLLDLGL